MRPLVTKHVTNMRALLDRVQGLCQLAMQPGIVRAVDIVSERNYSARLAELLLTISQLDGPQLDGCCTVRDEANIPHGSLNTQESFAISSDGAGPKQFTHSWPAVIFTNDQKVT